MSGAVSVTAAWQGRLGDWMEAKQRDHAGLHRILELGQMVQAATALIHELQRERGLSSGFVGSAGTRFAAELDSQRQRSDAALTHALGAWTALHEENLPAPLVHTLSSVREKLADLELLRIDVSALSLPTASTLERFIQLIESLFLVIAEAPGSSPHPKVTLALIALFHFVLAKEYTGRERALGSAVCAQGEADPHTVVALGRIQRQRSASLDVFLRHASLDQWTGWTELSDNETMASFQRLGQDLEAFCRGTGRKLPHPELWFEKASSVVDQYRTFEIRLLNDLDQLCLKILSQARSGIESEAVTPAPGSQAGLAARLQQDLSKLEASLADWAGLVAQVRILALDASIEAMPRNQVGASARDLHEHLARELTSVRQAAAGVRQAVERSLEAGFGAQEAVHEA